MTCRKLTRFASPLIARSTEANIKNLEVAPTIPRFPPCAFLAQPQRMRRTIPQREPYPTAKILGNVAWVKKRESDSRSEPFYTRPWSRTPEQDLRDRAATSRSSRLGRRILPGAPPDTRVGPAETNG